MKTVYLWYFNFWKKHSTALVWTAKCDIGVFASLDHLMILVQKCCMVGRGTFSWFFHILGRSVLVSFPQKKQFRKLQVPTHSLCISFLLKCLCQSLVVGCTLGQGLLSPVEGQSRMRWGRGGMEQDSPCPRWVGMTMTKQHCWPVKGEQDWQQDCFKV